jgi:hypothetical protein
VIALAGSLAVIGATLAVRRAVLAWQASQIVTAQTTPQLVTV